MIVDFFLNSGSKLRWQIISFFRVFFYINKKQVFFVYTTFLLSFVLMPGMSHGAVFKESGDASVAFNEIKPSVHSTVNASHIPYKEDAERSAGTSWKVLTFLLIFVFSAIFLFLFLKKNRSQKTGVKLSGNGFNIFFKNHQNEAADAAMPIISHKQRIDPQTYLCVIEWGTMQYLLTVTGVNSHVIDSRLKVSLSETQEAASHHPLSSTELVL